ncbi:MAG: peptigoglycan-binding protein LysM [Alphaproteobacteria bacterium]|nr:peptigoglycan-binding protein LysM [Alphaproteobacteria bacterium]
MRGLVLAILLTLALAPARAQDMMGAPRIVIARAADTLPDLALEHGLGFTELLAANRNVDPWIPGAGTPITLPTQRLLPKTRRGIVINLAEQRLYFFPELGAPLSFPLGIGDEGWESPKGRSTIQRKRPNPTWHPPKSIRAEDPTLPEVVPPGPDNPLGAFALDTGFPSIVIHGTNKPYGVGRRVSHGCFRLHDQDIARLFALVSVGTSVLIIDEPMKLGWHEGQLHLEIHPTQKQADQIEQTGGFAPEPMPELENRVMEAAGVDWQRVDWQAVEAVAFARRGIPYRITR